MSGATTIARVGIKPKVGFAGLGWIGRTRLEVLLNEGAVQPAALADADGGRMLDASQIAPGARQATLEQMLQDPEIGGIVLATPSAMHADQAIQALRAGKAVFCQKPLGRDYPETQAVVNEARLADRLLRVDFCYRHIQGVSTAREMALSGELGDIYAAELIFHNVYGPGNAWSYDPKLAGGGCLIDLGIHLMDLALWILNTKNVRVEGAVLRRKGRPWAGRETEIEDHASALLTLGGQVTTTLSCSWALSGGCDAVIGARLYGTRGGIGIHNLGGSFYDFAVERYDGSRTRVIGECSKQWAGGAVAAWAARLAENAGYDNDTDQIPSVAYALDLIYAKASERA